MKTITYILGLLLRLGPQHGYQIKKHIQEQLADFTHIKLPVIYYHLGRMEKAGLVTSGAGQTLNRPPKMIYTITKKGKTQFQQQLNQLAQFDYQAEFASDAAFYFSDALAPTLLIKNIRQHAQRMQSALEKLAQHRVAALAGIPAEFQKEAGIIFDHHQRHGQAELDWARETLGNLQA